MSAQGLCAREGALSATWKGHQAEVSAVAFSPDGKTVLSGSADRTLKLWDVASGEVLATWKGHEEDVTAVAFTWDGKRAVSGSEDLTLKVWDVASGIELASLKGHLDEIRRISLSPDGRLAATISFDGVLKIWDLKTGAERATLQAGETPEALDAVFSPDGKTVVVGLWDSTIRLYDVESKELLSTWKDHHRPVMAVTFSPDGTKVLSGSRDRTLRLWDAKSGKVLAVFKGHTNDVYRVAFSPDGRSAYSAGVDLILKKWDTESGEERGTWKGHQDGTPAVAFSPDGRFAVSAAGRLNLKLWDLSAESSRKAGARTPTKARIWTGRPKEELGRMLFFDRRLSGDSSFDCAKCHIPEKAFTDNRELSLGYPETLYFRNTPTLLNAAEQRDLYWDARFPASDLPSLVRDHIAEAHFMNADGRLIVEKLRQTPGYVKKFSEVYAGQPTYAGILDSLTAFLRTLKSEEASFDRYLRGDASAISPAAVRGLNLFEKEAGCIRCHNGKYFSDGRAHRRDVPENPEILADPLRHISFRRFFKLLGVKDYASLARDVGLYAVTKSERDRRKFRTPSLREVSRTPPYMHNGIFKTLEEAVQFENPKLRRSQVADIVEFLKTLSGTNLLVEPAPYPEYALRPVRQRTKKVSLAKAPVRPLPLPALSDFPKLGPLPKVPEPKDNPTTPAKAELGKLLFFESLLSGNGDASCAACHEPSLGWDDNRRVARGYLGAMHWRNAQTVLNSGYLTRLNWDGNKTSLEEQARAAIENNIVSNGDPAMIEERLAQIPRYRELFKEAFGVDRPFFEGVLKAIAVFERSALVSRNVPFDAYARGDKNALTKSAQRGLELFGGKAGCIRCHNGPFVSDQGFHATGVPRSPIFETLVLRQITMRYQHVIRGVPEDVFLEADSDPGLYLTTLREEDVGKFRTPSLRELKFTAPYMHNGMLTTLEEVIEFYDKGGGTAANKTPLLAPLNLQHDEKEDLLAFLESLSGEEIIIRRPRQLGYEPTVPREDTEL